MNTARHAIIAARNEVTKADSKRHILVGQTMGLSKEIKVEQGALKNERIEKAKELVDEIARTTGLKENEDKNIVTQILNIVSDVNSVRTFMLGVVYDMVTLQGEILTLLLVIVMGMLGGLIHLAQSFLGKDSDETWAFYLFRPLLGIVAALGIYILARAGVLVISDAQNTGATLSPFFISFLAIISGLLAENAINNIRGAGNNVLKNQTLPGTNRWSLPLLQDQVANRNLDDLAILTGASRGDVDDWIAGRKEVSSRNQNLIAAWVDTPRNVLFTDIAPPAQAGDGDRDE